MTDFDLSPFKAIIFDCYGTLVDWESGIYTGLQPLLARFPSSATWSRKEALLAFTEIEKDLQASDPSILYRDLLSQAHRVLTRTLQETHAGEIPVSIPEEEHAAFGQSIKDWPVFPDTCEALRVLEQHYKLTILSNVDHNSFAATHAKLSQDTANQSAYVRGAAPGQNWLPKSISGCKSPFSLILTAQDTGAYKPDPSSMSCALDAIRSEFGVDGSQVLVVAQSLFHDVDPSSRMGISAVWIDRQGAVMGLETSGEAPKWKRRFETLGEMAASLEAT
ncbi:unnamed protein product [Mycena citricolor]|uniref:Haloacid dehalogenase n=2 Tax=Mycena citricolor TaxID=2018698 RepID=A0AAD2GRW7_9AGAR|nr:unnamed protein product [Mycena citricolor]